jgi:hypothetical protein
MNEDLVVWGLCAGVILFITFLSYITHLSFKPREKERAGATPTAATLKWFRELKKRTIFPGIFRNLATSHGASRIEGDLQDS